MTTDVQICELFISKKIFGFWKFTFVIEQIQLLGKMLINPNKNCTLDVLKLEIDPLISIKVTT